MKKTVFFCLTFFYTLFCHQSIAIAMQSPALGPTKYGNKLMLVSEQLKRCLQYLHENNPDNLKTFFEHDDWQKCQDKERVLELFLQNAIVWHNPKILQCLFDNGAKINIHARSANPEKFEIYYVQRVREAEYYLGDAYGNLFHLLLHTPYRRRLNSCNLDACKLLIKQAIIEEIKTTKKRCLNTFILCMFRQNFQGNTPFCKDIRNLLQKHLIIALESDESCAIVAQSCQNITSSLKIILSEKAGYNKDCTPCDIIDGIWHRRNGIRDRPIRDPAIIEKIEHIWYRLTPIETELMKLLDPQRVHATVSEMANEMYPKLEISIADPNVSLLSKAMNELSRLFGAKQ